MVNLSQVVIFDWCQWELCPVSQWNSLMHLFPGVVKQFCVILCILAVPCIVIFCGDYLAHILHEGHLHFFFT